jgi:IS5 family transposase
MAGLFDYEFQLERINKHQPPLQKLDKIIDWEIFRKILEEAFINPDRKSNAGRKSYDKLLMFKIVMLQKYYNLSDEQTEFQIKDRLSFLDFLGLQIGDRVPDEKTIWLFKEDLADKGLSETLFALFADALVSNGIVAKEGTIVDASFVSVPRQRNSREENTQIKQGETPESFKSNPHKQAQKDRDARWTKKNNQTEYGYKNHIAGDQKTKLITKYEVTPASTHDSQVTRKLIDETDKVFYADGAYYSNDTEKYLKKANVKSKVIKRKYRNKALSKSDHKENYKHSKTRVRIEHIFGTMTSQMHNVLNITSIGIKRARSSIGLINLLYNMVRYEQLVRLKGVKVI